MKIGIIGAGYVGTVTGTCLAELGHTVTCVDPSESRMAKLQAGQVPFYEPGLEPMLRANLEEGRLRFTADIADGLKDAEIIFLCVGTVLQPNGKPDLKPLQRAAREVAQALADGSGYRLIVEKSTMPIQTGEWLRSLLRDALPAEADFDIAAVPHFLREGTAVRDFMRPERIVIGTDSQRAANLLLSLYQPLNAPVLHTDINSAELIKHATNAFLAMKISFINSIARICEKTGADITHVSRGLGLDRRISPDYLNAGVGYGGIFFPKDIQSLLNIAEAHHINLDLLKATEVTNRYQRIQFIEKLEEALENDHPGNALEGKTIALWGIAFRPHSDDLRDTPAITIIRGLLNRGAKLRAYDPLAMPAAQDILPEVTYCDSPEAAAEGADAIAILTDWEDFHGINFKALKARTRCRLIVDGRNLYNREPLAALGFRYVSFGRTVLPPAADVEPETTPPPAKRPPQNPPLTAAR